MRSQIEVLVPKWCLQRGAELRNRKLLMSMKTSSWQRTSIPFAFSLRKRQFPAFTALHQGKVQRKRCFISLIAHEIEKIYIKMQGTLEIYHLIAQKVLSQWKEFGLEGQSPLLPGTALTWITGVELVQLPARITCSFFRDSKQMWTPPKKNSLWLVQFDELSSGLNDFCPQVGSE